MTSDGKAFVFGGHHGKHPDQPNLGTYARRVVETGRTERSERLAAEAERITRFLGDRGATLVVVFGSFARGETGRWSDLDMIAVMESDLPFIARLGELYRGMVPTVGLDLLVYTPEEWEYMQHRSFVRRALAEGKVLHAA